MTLGWGPNIHPWLYKTFKALADDLEIPYQIEVMPRHSGTDAYAIQVVAQGMPSMVMGIPLRYMHTPVEVSSEGYQAGWPAAGRVYRPAGPGLPPKDPAG